MAETAQGRQRRVLIVTNVPAPADRWLWAKGTALARAGYDVSVICPKRRSTEKPEEIIDGVRVFRHPLPIWAPSLVRRFLETPLALFWQFVLSIKVARRHGIEVIHLCNPPNIIFLVGAFHKIIAKKSILFDYRDSTFENSARSKSGGSLVERLAFKTADLCLFTNESHRIIAINRGHMVAQKGLVLRPCPDLERVTPTRPDPLLRNGRAHMVAYAGEVSRAEGVDLLLDVIEYIVHKLQRADIQFVIAGTGSEWQEIASICGKLDLSDYVTFTGRTDDEALFTILSSADVCVDPRRLTPENAVNTSEKILEYMAMGKPIVQFDMPEGRILAQDSSLYAQDNDPIHFGEQILDLIDRPQTRAKMGSLGQQRVRRELSWDREKRRLLIAYDGLFDMRRKRLEGRKRQKAPKMPKAKISKQK